MQNLQQVRHLRELIASHYSELQRLRSINDLRSSLANVGNGGGGHSTVSAAVLRAEKRADLETRIVAEINELLALWDELHAAIENIEDNDERLVLRMRYIEEERMFDISKVMHLSMRQTWRIHDEGVKKLKLGTQCH